VKSGGLRAGAGRVKVLGSRGQSMTEFALLLPLFLFMLFMAITFAVIGQAALAVSQLAYNGARYAAVNPTLSANQIASYIKSGSLGSPTITANGGADLTVTVASASARGQPLTVTIAYNLASNSLVSNMSNMFAMLGMSQVLPTTLSATESAMSE
jgi:Flp pilus assembly protein TadG